VVSALAAVALAGGARTQDPGSGAAKLLKQFTAEQ
jgi:hypothetical protein